MNLNLTADTVNDISILATGTFSTDALTDGTVKLGCNVSESSTGKNYIGAGQIYDGKSTRDYSYANGSVLSVNFARGEWVYQRLLEDAQDNQADTYVFTFSLSDGTDKVGKSISVTTVPNVTIRGFAASACLDTAEVVTGTIDFSVTKDSLSGIQVDVSSAGTQQGERQEYRNNQNEYSWTYADGSVFSIDMNKKTWNYVRPAGDVGNKKSDNYVFILRIYENGEHLASATANIATTVVYPPSITTLNVNTVDDTASVISGKLTIANWSGSNITISMTKNGTGYTADKKPYTNTSDMTWNYSDGSNLVLKKDGTLSFTRTAKDVGNLTVDTYSFIVTIESATGSDSLSAATTTTVPTASITSFRADTVADTAETIDGILSYTLPASIVGTATAQADVTCNGVRYQGKAVEISKSSTSFSFKYPNGAEFIVGSGTFTFKRPEADITDTAPDTYVMEFIIKVNNQTVSKTATAETLAGRTVYDYSVAYPIDLSPGTTDTVVTLAQKTVLEFERIYRLINSNMSRMEELANYINNQYANANKKMTDLEEFVTKAIANMFPIGTIVAYSGDKSKIPDGWALCDGTKGTPDLRNRFLEGWGRHSVKAMTEAGLPDITGSFRTWKCDPITVGSFSHRYLGAICNSRDGGSDGGWYVDFKASKSNGVYGKSDTVQPASYTVYYIMKVA